MAKANDTLIARYESRGGRYWLKVYAYDWDGKTFYDIRTDNSAACGVSAEDIGKRVEQELSYMPVEKMYLKQCVMPIPIWVNAIEFGAKKQ